MSLDVSLVYKYPACSCCGRPEESKCVFDANITHNLNAMADAAGIYQACWRPEEISATKAKHIEPLLRIGLEKLKSNPTKFKHFNSSNGWGLYENFVPWVEEYLKACVENPEAEITVSR